MEVPVLFYDPTSEPCRAVYWLCLEAAIPIELRYVWLTRNEHLSENILKVNPMGQLPALQHGDFCLSEATAIMQYLTDVNHCTGGWFGKGEKERAIINKFLSWYHTNLRTKLTLEYFLPVFLMPGYLGHPKPEENFIEERTQALHAMLAQLDAMLVGHQYLAGNNFSAADILYASDVSALFLAPQSLQILARYSNLSGWLNNLQLRPGYKESHRVWRYAAALVKDTPTVAGGTPNWIADACEELI